jgi:hypothetical protein
MARRAGLGRATERAAAHLSLARPSAVRKNLFKRRQIPAISNGRSLCLVPRELVEALPANSAGLMAPLVICSSASDLHNFVAIHGKGNTAQKKENEGRKCPDYSRPHCGPWPCSAVWRSAPSSPGLKRLQFTYLCALWAMTLTRRAATRCTTARLLVWTTATRRSGAFRVQPLPFTSVISRQTQRSKMVACAPRDKPCSQGRNLHSDAPG